MEGRQGYLAFDGRSKKTAYDRWSEGRGSGAGDVEPHGTREPEYHKPRKPRGRRSLVERDPIRVRTFVRNVDCLATVTPEEARNLLRKYFHSFGPGENMDASKLSDVYVVSQVRKIRDSYYRALERYEQTGSLFE